MPIKIKFKFYVEDCDCQYCLYYIGNGKTRRKRCSIARFPCCCKDIKREAKESGRITREPENDEQGSIL